MNDRPRKEAQPMQVDQDIPDMLGGPDRERSYEVRFVWFIRWNCCQMRVPSTSQTATNLGFSYDPPLFTDFAIIDEGKLPFLTFLPRMKSSSRDQEYLFIRSLDIECQRRVREGQVSAHKGWQPHAASSFRAVADVPDPASLPRSECPDSSRCGAGTATTGC